MKYVLVYHGIGSRFAIYESQLVTRRIEFCNFAYRLRIVTCIAYRRYWIKVGDKVVKWHTNCETKTNRNAVIYSRSRHPRYENKHNLASAMFVKSIRNNNWFAISRCYDDDVFSAVENIDFARAIVHDMVCSTVQHIQSVSSFIRIMLMHVSLCPRACVCVTNVCYFNAINWAVAHMSSSYVFAELWVSSVCSCVPCIHLNYYYNFVLQMSWHRDAMAQKNTHTTGFSLFSYIIAVVHRFVVRQTHQCQAGE